MNDATAISIERAAASEAPLVAELVHRLLEELSGGKAPPLATLTVTAGRLLAGDRVTALIARLGGRPVGVITLNDCAAIYAGGSFGEISELYVLPRHRSAGVAPCLIAAAKQIAREKGWGRLEVGAPGQPTWNRTLQFYLREGFEEVGPRLRVSI